MARLCVLPSFAKVSIVTVALAIDIEHRSAKARDDQGEKLVTR